MRVRWWVQIITLAASCYNMGTIWMTQVCWRLFAQVGRGDFPAYHRAWWFGRRGIQPVVFPGGLLVTAWVSTAAWWGRLQGQLEYVRQEDGTLNPLYQRLLATHWLRVALFTASALLQIAMAAGTRETLPSVGAAPTEVAATEAATTAGRA